MLGYAGDAGVPAVFSDKGPTASRSWKLHLCEQDYHKLLEFFFSDSVPSELGHLLWRSVQPVKVAPVSPRNKHALVGPARDSAARGLYWHALHSPVR